ncbi:MAG TPA: S24/S26 family peptidase [Bryobacteraceae bacterium]|nr:S24/S26 family peptidase [Bryobacteraceae bacterium]
MDPAAPASGDSVKLELAAETARKFGTIKIKVTGDSMLPSVWPGDVLTVVRQPLARFRPGDLVLAARHRAGDPPHALEFVAHRVVRKEVRKDVPRQSPCLITRGDSLAHPDAPWEEHEILGRVAAVTRNGRRIDPSLTPARRMAAWVLRRSEVSVRVLLRFNRRPTGS